MSSSPEAGIESRVVRGSSASSATGLATPELRSGEWTRLGGGTVLGDRVTENTLATLAESTRAAARSQGYSVGWAQGRREADETARRAAEQTAQQQAAAEARREAEHRAAVTALELAAARLDETLTELSARVDAQASELAFELTRMLVGRELAVATDPGADAVRRVLAELPGRTDVRVRLHPDVAQGAAAADLAGHGVVVVPDHSLAVTEALVEAEGHVLDLRVDTAIERLRRVMA
jgi:flagellar assembly protein FliH